MYQANNIQRLISAIFVRHSVKEKQSAYARISIES